MPLLLWHIRQMRCVVLQCLRRYMKQLQSKKVIMGLLLGVLVFTFPVIVNDSNMQILHGVSWLFSTLFF